MELIISGGQCGDEGKGKFTDLFSEKAHAVVRYQGGPHTGHTVAVGENVYRFVQVPSGVLHGAKGILANGCVVEPRGLLAEIESLRSSGVAFEFLISPQCHIVLPYHRAQDEAMERWRGAELATAPGTGLRDGVGRLGSTKKGVGPCREDKIARIGVRVVDLLDTDSLRTRITKLIQLKQKVIENAFGVPLGELECYIESDWQADSLVDSLIECGQRLAPSLCDVSAFLAAARARGEYIVYEGAQSVALDIDHGTYPFCSSGNSSAHGVCVGTGSPASTDLIACSVMKAYTTRAGGGPLPTELFGSIADHIVERGREFGTVTGRRRRVGWLDLCFLRKAIQVDAPQYVCVSCIDVLAGLPEVKIATHYNIAGEIILTYPPRLSSAAVMTPAFESFAGWDDVDWTDVATRGFAALPRNRARLRRVHRGLTRRESRGTGHRASPRG